MSQGRVFRGRSISGGELTFRVEGGRVAAVGREAGEPDVDFGDRLVLPGFIDTHVHFRDPGAPAKEDFTSGSTSAAFGGVTTVMDMPNTDPPATTIEAWRAKLRRARIRSVVDFGIYVGLGSDASLEVLPEAPAMKVYLGSTTGDLLVEDPGLVGRALKAAERAGRTVAFHMESEACLREHAHARTSASFEAHYWSRPNRCESEAIEAVARLPPSRTARVHVCHLSTADGLSALPERWTAEVAPHHLLLTKDDLARGGRFKMNPPLRPRADRDALLAALAAGRVHLASDHAPHTPEEKAQGVWACPAGVPGVETMGPLLLALAFAGKLPLDRVVDALTRKPAETFGLAGKGRLEPGHDADFVVVDPSAVEPVRADRLHSRAGWTPFEGMPAVFPQEVWLRGERIVEGRALLGGAGRGRAVSVGAPLPNSKPS